jgi:hypothetical protein
MIMSFQRVEALGKIVISSILVASLLLVPEKGHATSNSQKLQTSTIVLPLKANRQEDWPLRRSLY